MRRKLANLFDAVVCGGNISAYAERTQTWPLSAFAGAEHLHVREENFFIPQDCRCPTEHLHARGENWQVSSALSRAIGTPPCAWRKLRPLPHRRHLCRNISTYAEKTEPFTNYLYLMREHLRVCGENTY